ncbi:hypothetical protein CA13_19230 [Planctomycetes bacterium CA13]|uniref:Uncharacterized protein n=1 Tax=Novipirellula herctigrandis TaxID=2527986 RepID=A0A5C5YZN9_9BACT|nr:hypothetical protein CA13_19230 [Planctomycetes bacterium CA13]
MKFEVRKVKCEECRHPTSNFSLQTSKRRLERLNYACFTFLFRHYDRPRVIQARGRAENTHAQIILSTITET